MTLETLYNVVGMFKNKAELGIDSYSSGLWIVKYDKDGENILLEINFRKPRFWIFEKERWDLETLTKIIAMANAENIEVKGL
jgi:hypothetical protein